MFPLGQIWYEYPRLLSTNYWAWGSQWRPTLMDDVHMSGQLSTNCLWRPTAAALLLLATVARVTPFVNRVLHQCSTQHYSFASCVTVSRQFATRDLEAVIIISNSDWQHCCLRCKLELRFVRKIGFEYHVSEIFEYSNTFDYYSTSCFINQPAVVRLKRCLTSIFLS